MGLTNYRSSKVRKQDVTIAKNYFNEDEIAALNNLVEQYLIFAQGQALRRIPMYMSDWIKKLDGFLTINDRDILNHAGKISHEMAKQLAEGEYAQFHSNRLTTSTKELNDFDKVVNQIEASKKEGGEIMNKHFSCFSWFKNINVVLRLSWLIMCMGNTYISQIRH